MFKVARVVNRFKSPFLYKILKMQHLFNKYIYVISFFFLFPFACDMRSRAIHRQVNWDISSNLTIVQQLLKSKQIIKIIYQKFYKKCRSFKAYILKRTTGHYASGISNKQIKKIYSTLRSYKNILCN